MSEAGGRVRVTRLDDITSVDDAGVRWLPVRLELGIGAFGVNAYSASKQGDQLIEEHDETSAGAGRHEELYVVVRGAARFTIDGEDIDAPAGTLVFVPDRESRRVAYAAADDTVALVVGGVRGQAYSPSPWEASSAAAAFVRRGDRERGVELAAAALREHPDHPSVLYNVACAEALAGDGEAAIGHLRRAIELEPRSAQWAADDSDLDPIRDDPRFPS